MAPGMPLGDAARLRGAPRSSGFGQLAEAASAARAGDARMISPLLGELIEELRRGA